MRTHFSRASAWLAGHAALVGALAAGGLAVGLYARTVHFAFFGDDPTGYFRWMEGVSWAGLFTSSPGFFLRPLVFVVCKLLLLIYGGYSAPGFHIVLLILHVANTVLLGLLASSLSGRRRLGWVAALLFATFPLSQEAVAEFDAICHPLLVFWTLLALLLYERGRRTGSRLALWAAYPAVMFALLSHENGLIVPFLLAGLELVRYPPTSVRDFLRRPALRYFLLAALFLLWWSLVPKGSTLAPRGLIALLRNTLPFLQVVAYPLLPGIRLAVTQWLGLLALVGLSLGLTYVAARALRLRRLWLFVIAWIALAAGPSILFLDWDYLHAGPRLYYLASAGGALLWALLPSGLPAVIRIPVARGWMALGAGALASLAIALPPLPYIRCQLDLVDQATHLVREVSAEASTAPLDRDLVYVNLPVYLTADAEHPQGCPTTYPFVVTGVGVFPPYGNLRDFIRVNGGPDRRASGVTVKEYGTDWPPRYGETLPLSAVRKTLRDDQVYVFDIESWSLRNLSSVWQPDAPREVPLATFGDFLTLQHAVVRHGKRGLIVTLDWRVTRVPTSTLTAFAHLYDPAGKLLAQHDGLPGQNGVTLSMVPMSLWRVGDTIQDVHTISLDNSSPADDSTVAVGLYDSATVERLTALSPEGWALADNLYRLKP